MISDANPYKTPDESLADLPVASRFESWSNLHLVGLFFIPSIVFIIAFLVVIALKASIIMLLGLSLAIILALAVSLLSAFIHTSRQTAGKRTLILFSVVYLFAQAFAIFLCIAGFQVVLT